MNDFNLPQLIYVLRQNVSHMSRLLMLLLVSNICFILAGTGFAVFLYKPSETALGFAAAMLGAACIPAALGIQTLRQMVREDLVLPAE